MSNTSKELAPERQVRIADYIRGKGVARIEELLAEFNISIATLRRDLDVLEKQGRIRKVHGGAVFHDQKLQEPLFDDKTAIASEEKKRIAAKALSLIESGDSIYLDGGSTVLELARLLAQRKDITVATNSLRAAVELSGRGPRLILIGGELRRLSQTTVGTLTRLVLDEIRVVKAFMGTMGFSLPEGPTTSDPNEAYTKKLVMERADQVILMMDSSKAGKKAFARAGDIRHVTTIISDKGFPAPLTKSLTKLGITVECV